MRYEIQILGFVYLNFIGDFHDQDKQSGGGDGLQQRFW